MHCKICVHWCSLFNCININSKIEIVTYLLKQSNLNYNDLESKTAMFHLTLSVNSMASLNFPFYV